MSRKPTLPAPEQFVALSCIVVGAGSGGDTPMLARVSLVDYRGQVILDRYVQPTPGVRVADYRTATTGIEAHHLSPTNAMPFLDAQDMVAKLVHGKIIVGHALWSDFAVLGISHPAVATRDVALYRPFRNALQMQQVIGLPTLMWRLMRRSVQEGKLDSLENARAAIDLYRSHSGEWEDTISGGRWPTVVPPHTHSRCYL